MQKLLPSEQIKTTTKITSVLWKSFRRRKIEKKAYANSINKCMSEVDREKRKQCMKKCCHKKKFVKSFI